MIIRPNEQLQHQNTFVCHHLPISDCSDQCSLLVRDRASAVQSYHRPLEKDRTEQQHV